MTYGVYSNGDLIAALVAPVTVRNVVPIFSSDSLSMKRHTLERSVQRWEITTKLMPLSSGGNKLFALSVMAGHSGYYDISMPQNYGVIMDSTAAGGVTASGTAGNTFVTVAGLTGFMPIGTFVKFTGHNKVYMTKADRSGSGNLQIFPALRQSISGASMKYKEDVIAQFTLDLDGVSGMAYTDGILMDNGELKFIEVI